MAEGEHALADAVGLGDAGRRLAATLLDIGRNRLALAAVELEQERHRLASLWVAAAVALFLSFLALVLLAAWLVMWVPPEHRVLALGLLAGGCTGMAGVALYRWRAMAAAKPPLLADTVGELRRDAAALRPQAPAEAGS